MSAFLSLSRVIKFAFQDMLRNLSLSLMTIFILILMLLSVNTLLGIRLLTEEATAEVKQQIDVSVYFDHGATDKQIDEVRQFVKSFPEVVDTTFLNKDEVLAQFRLEHKDNPEIIASLDELGDNPLGATLVIKTKEPSDYSKIIAGLNVPEYQNIIEAKTFGDTEKAINRIHTITTQVERFSLAVSTMFGIIAFLIIFNTIRVAIYTQRMEISIKKLVGASNWFVRGPYLIESIFFTIVSTVLSFALLYGASRFLDPYVAVVFSNSGFLTNYFLSHIVLLFSVQFGAVLVLTVLSSSLAMRKYLRV